MFVTRDVSKFSGWLNAFATCMPSRKREAHTDGAGGEVQARAGRDNGRQRRKQSVQARAPTRLMWGEGYTRVKRT